MKKKNYKNPIKESFYDDTFSYFNLESSDSEALYEGEIEMEHLLEDYHIEDFDVSELTDNIDDETSMNNLYTQGDGRPGAHEAGLRAARSLRPGSRPHPPAPEVRSTAADAHQAKTDAAGGPRSTAVAADRRPGAPPVARVPTRVPPITLESLFVGTHWD